MTKQDLMKAIATKTGTTMKQAEEFYDATIKSIAEFCGDFNADDQRVSLPGFGILKVKRKEAYVSRNPFNGEPVDVPESRRVTFTASKQFKEMVNAEPVKKTAKKSTASAKKTSTTAKKTAAPAKKPVGKKVVAKKVNKKK